MKSSKQITLKAKEMFKKSFSNDFVDPQKVRSVLKEFLIQKEAKTLKVLKVYRNLMSQTLSWQETVVESALGILTEDQKRSILTKTKAHTLKVVKNPKIVAGAKIYHGDWVWEQTLEGKLKQLTINN